VFVFFLIFITDDEKKSKRENHGIVCFVCVLSDKIMTTSYHANCTWEESKRRRRRRKI